MSWPTKVILNLLLLFIFIQSHGQDSTSYVDWYQHFFQEINPQHAEEEIILTRERLLNAEARKDAHTEAHQLKELGLLYLTRKLEYDTATDLLIKSLIIEDSLDLKKEKLFTYLALAQVFEDVGDYYQSGKFLDQALDLHTSDDDLSTLALILMHQGNVHALSGRIDEAFENYQQILQYKDQLQQPSIEADALFNLGKLYAMQGRSAEALKKHKEALAIRRAIHDKRNEAVSLNEVGELCRLTKDSKRALANHVAALEIRQALKDKKGIAESYNNIGLLFYSQKDFKRAIANVNFALAAGQDAQDQVQQRKSFELLSLCYEALGDFKLALKNKNLFQAMNDFIQNEINERNLLELQNRYVIQKKETQISNLELDRIARERQLKEQQQFRNILFVFIGLAVIIAALVAYLYFLKRRSHTELEAVNDVINHKNQELEDLNATKDKFFSIISHDLKGPLNSLTSFSSLLINHIENLSKEEIQMLAKDLDKSIKNLFELLENLLEWSRSQTGNIEFTPEPIELNQLLALNAELLYAQANAKKIAIINNAKNSIQVKAHKNSVNTVIRNLVSNAIKFTPEGGTITLALQQKANEVIVSVADTGVGMSEEVVKKLFRLDTKLTTKGTANEKGTGLGLILCKEFVEKNCGRMGVESEVGKGSRFYFSLPLQG
ncbi:MAG TPA: tetratricopeptide repeat-containing sensor histidine kinase [Cyclobacteriaceae bacterium]|jgi:signal transduction histidine kinase|nr:tetratricopeptide repeat-containing sensor histidine kinase [Cyclobacteriaceae bacterium]